MKGLIISDSGNRRLSDQKIQFSSMMTKQLNFKWLKRIFVATFIVFLFLYRAGSAQSVPFRIVTAEEPPTNFTQNGELTGIVTEIVEAILASLHLKADINVYPWARAYNTALTEPNIIIFTAGKTQERIDHGFSFVGPVTTRRHILYKKAGRMLTVNGIEDIKRQQLRVGAMRGDWRGKFFMDHGVTVEEVTTHPQNIKKVLADRIDLVALSDLELGENLQLAGVSRDQIESAYIFQERDAYILLSKDTSPQIITQWKEAFTALQSTDFFEKTAQKWSSRLGLTLHYAVDKGFYIQR